MITVLQIADSLLATMWAMLRVSGLVLVAPLLGAVFVPARVRVLVAAVLAVAMLPVIPEIPQYAPLSQFGLATIAKELLIGLSIGFVIKLAIEAAVFAGQVVSMGMGLAFATAVDPQQGSIPLIGRLYIIVATLLLLATNAHLAMIQVLAESYRLMPLGGPGIDGGIAREIVGFASVMFTGAMHLALPSIVAILMVNVSFGVISRAAPTLNLFAVGFPITMTMGFIIMMIAIRNHGAVWNLQFAEAFTMMARILGGS